MNTNTQMNHKKAIELTQALLRNTYFEGFKFDTSFTLRFSRNTKSQFQGYLLPMRIELRLLHDWWFYSRKEWEKRLAHFPLKDSVEPDEPVQAFELANLRWSEESIVKCVSLNDKRLFISFNNGKEITASCEESEGESWVLCEYGVDEANQLWSVVCEDGNLFVRTP